MGKESTQHKLDRVRAPRVQITYDVETGGAIVMKELPFVMGVMADLSGTGKPEKELKQRKFVDISRDNFDEVLKGFAPELTYSVENTLEDNNTKVGVKLEFESMDDFHPDAIVQKVPELKQLLDVRNQLFELLAKADGNDKLTDKLQEILNNTEQLQKLANDAGVTAGTDSSKEAEKETST